MSRCLSCGSSYVTDALTEQQLRAIYENESGFYDVELHWEYQGHGKRLEELRALVTAPNGRTPRLLDVGCGTGEFLALAAATQGWEGHGTEFAERPIRLAKERRGLNIISRDLSDDPRDGFYDIITLWGLVEHVQAPDDLIAQVARLLSPGGIVGILTPVLGLYDRLAYLVYRSSGRRLTNLLDLRNNKAHLSILSERALSSLLEKQGLRILVRRRVTELGRPAENYLRNIAVRNSVVVATLSSAMRYAERHGLFFRNNMLVYAQKPA